VDYKNHAIVASAFEDATHKWIPNITISWTSVGCQLVHHLRPLMVKSHPDYFLTSFASCQDADFFGVQRAKAWIDDHPCNLG
jgi:hypothetical protein